MEHQHNVLETAGCTRCRYTKDATPTATAVQAARWLRALNHTADPTTGLLVLGQGVVGSAAAVAAAADTRPYHLSTNSAAESLMAKGRAAVLIDAAPSLSELYSDAFPLVGVRFKHLHCFRANVDASEMLRLLCGRQGVVNWAYGGEPYELVKNLGEDGQGGGALGSLLLPRPAGPVPDRNRPVCPGTRLLVVSYGAYNIILQKLAYPCNNQLTMDTIAGPCEQVPKPVLFR